MKKKLYTVSEIIRTLERQLDMLPQVAYHLHTRADGMPRDRAIEIMDEADQHMDVYEAMMAICDSLIQAVADGDQAGITSARDGQTSTAFGRFFFCAGPAGKE